MSIVQEISSIKPAAGAPRWRVERAQRRGAQYIKIAKLELVDKQIRLSEAFANGQLDLAEKYGNEVDDLIDAIGEANKIFLTF